jgi:hypothetical protein
MQERAASLRPVLAAGIGAGLIGAVSLDAYSIVTTALIDHARHTELLVSIGAFFQPYAALLVGKGAALNPNLVWLGIAANLAISIAWGIGYAYVASRKPNILARPFGIGVLYGFIVYAVLQLMEVVANIFVAPDALRFYNDLLAYTLFFGVPVAYVVGRRMRA